MIESNPNASPMRLGRDLLVAGVVVVAHGSALLAVQHALEHQPPPVKQVQIIAAELITPAVPILEEPPPTPPPPVPPSPVPPPPEPPPPEPPKPKPPKPKVTPKKAPKPTPRPVAPLPVETDSPTAMSVPPAPEVDDKPDPETGPPGAPRLPGPPGPPAPPAPPQIVLPSTKAAYLNNPRPPYPAMSKRLGETGTVVLRVLVGADGTAKDVRIHKSSGFERLDIAAQEAVRKWRFVPGTKDGVPSDLWFNIPWKWELND